MENFALYHPYIWNIFPLWLARWAYIAILWAKHGKYRSPFSMFTLYITLMWKFRADEDDTIAQLWDDTFEIIPV